VNALSLGLALFAAGAGFVIWQAHGVIRRGADDALVLAVAAASTSLLGFVVLTRMHERYLLTALALLAPLAFLRPLRLVYAGLSALFVLNLWWVYAGVGFGGFHTVATRFWSLAVTALAATLAYYAARWAARAGAEETPPATAAMLQG
jgi:hypothetical protein